MKRKQLLAAALAMVLLASGCGGGSSKSAAGDMRVETAAPSASTPAAEAPKEKYEMEMAPVRDVMEGSTVYQRADAKLIRRCNLELQSTEFDAAVQSLYAVVGELGGYFESSSQRGGSYYNANAQRRGEYVVRIPAERYDEFRNGMGELGYVTYCNESTEDVGEQYYDTEARLKTLRTKQDRLLMLLEKAETMEDIITLESALSEVEYEIEQYSSTLNRYDGLISYATFNISLQEVLRVDEQAGEADTLWTRMGKGFSSGANNLVDGVQDLLVWFSYNVFGIVIFLAAGTGIILVLRKKKFKRFGRKQGKNNEETKD